MRFIFVFSFRYHVCVTCMSLVLFVARGEHWMPWCLSYRLSTYVGVLGIQGESSERADSALNHWVIPKPSENVSFIGVTYENMGEGWLTEREGLSDNCITLWRWCPMKLETCKSLHSFQAVQGKLEVSLMPPTTSPGSLSFLVWARQLDFCLLHGWSEHVLCSSDCVVCQQSLLIIYAWAMRALVNLASFCDFLKLLNYYFLVSWHFLYNWIFQLP